MLLRFLYYLSPSVRHEPVTTFLENSFGTESVNKQLHVTPIGIHAIHDSKHSHDINYWTAALPQKVQLFIWQFFGALLNTCIDFMHYQDNTNLDYANSTYITVTVSKYPFHLDVESHPLIEK